MSIPSYNEKNRASEEPALKRNWYRHFHEMWLKLTIKKKIFMFTGAVFSAILLSIAFDFWIIQYTLGDFQEVLEDNLRKES